MNPSEIGDPQPQVRVSASAVQEALGVRDWSILVLEAEVARLNAEVAALKAASGNRGEMMPS